MLGRKNDKTIISSVWKRIVFVFVFYVPAKRVGRRLITRNFLKSNPGIIGISHKYAGMVV